MPYVFEKANGINAAKQKFKPFLEKIYIYHNEDQKNANANNLEASCMLLNAKNTDEENFYVILYPKRTLEDYTVIADFITLYKEFYPTAYHEPVPLNITRVDITDKKSTRVGFKVNGEIEDVKNFLHNLFENNGLSKECLEDACNIIDNNKPSLHKRCNIM